MTSNSAEPNSTSASTTTAEDTDDVRAA